MMIRPLVLGLAVSVAITAYAGEVTAPKRTVHMDFHDVELKQAAKSIAEITGKNFVIPDHVNPKITIVSPTAVTVSEAYDAFVSALEVNGLTVCPVNKNLVKIIRVADMASCAPFEK